MSLPSAATTLVSTALSDPDASLRYTRDLGVPELMGWLVKHGKRLHQPKARFFRLRDANLSSHHDEHSPATWTLSLHNARVIAVPPRYRVLLYLPKRRRLSLVARDEADFRRWVICLVRASAFEISLRTFYEVGGVIGDGVNGDVLHGCDRATGDLVAIKTLAYAGDMMLKEDNVVEEEIRIAKSLDHPHLVRTLDVFRAPTEGKIHLVMEFVAGGELRERVDQPDGASLVTESDAVCVARNLLSALLYLHGHGVVHRDVKLENVLCVDADVNQPLQVKLADFGSSATIAKRGGRLRSTVGTGYYLAPEIIEEKYYDSSVDLWALGVLFYITLSGQLPFPGDEFHEYTKHVLNDPVEFEDDTWRGISEDAKDFISRLMEKDMRRRMSALEALGHPWLTCAGSERTTDPADSTTDPANSTEALQSRDGMDDSMIRSSDPEAYNAERDKG